MVSHIDCIFLSGHNEKYLNLFELNLSVRFCHLEGLYESYFLDWIATLMINLMTRTVRVPPHNDYPVTY